MSGTRQNTRATSQSSMCVRMVYLQTVHAKLSGSRAYGWRIIRSCFPCGFGTLEVSPTIKADGIPVEWPVILVSRSGPSFTDHNKPADGTLLP